MKENQQRDLQKLEVKLEVNKETKNIWSMKMIFPSFGNNFNAKICKEGLVYVAVTTSIVWHFDQTSYAEFASSA